MENHNPNTVIALFFVAVAVMLIGGLAVIPALQEAEAANGTSESRNKGQQGDKASRGNRAGGGGGINT